MLFPFKVHCQEIPGKLFLPWNELLAVLMKMNCEIIGKISGIYKGGIQYCTLQEEHGDHLMKQVPLLYK